MGAIIITADRGKFKAYRVDEDPLGVETPRLELIKSYNSIGAHTKPSEKYTDSPGSFKLGEGKEELAAGYGEPHNTALEEERRLIAAISRSINEIIRQEAPERWHLAAGKTINKRIIEALDPSVRSSLRKNIKADLTKADKSEVLRRFA